MNADLMVMPDWFFEGRGYHGDLEAEIEQQYAQDLQRAIEWGTGVSHIIARANIVRVGWEIRLHFANSGQGVLLETDWRGMGLKYPGVQLLDIDEFSLLGYDLSPGNESAVRMYVRRKMSKLWKQV